ncbi:protein-L-isoaspartate(D-aspartate) O-methyltransferase [Diaphorobacter sp. HDW4B]|uniref:protein-L-isoaspartate(D-aspartate) O-methyltransferase n=1 Tax=Diaphorobacter sp. HDW4B TaxID=2714925 RepID=UPI00140C627D|nr:protein-L-isoaspartate(D-aspartate) O-methyltransferase [Diaphorobacter sp. HDW4B]QIL69701.1 protein-L-isoaspartate(D-aspartate) O-methyltransferase [Diaphorobacter sp. HDW4B]
MNQRRPGFPARLPSASSGPGAPKPSMSNPVRAVPRVAPAPAGVGLDSSTVRERMVRRLADSGIGSASVLAAMGAIERHRFVDSALVNQAYEDTSLPIGLGQTISKPSIVARMAELLLGAPVAKTEGLGRILEIGTGCGYQAAVLGRIAKEVYTIERLRALHEKARDNLRPLRLTNVHLILGDGMLGYPKGAPYAAIISAAGGEQLPEQWCDQLAVGGRLVAPMAGPDGKQILLVVDKTTAGLKQTVLEAVNFVPLKSGVA